MGKRRRSLTNMLSWLARLGWLAALVTSVIWLWAQQPFNPPVEVLDDQAARAALDSAVAARVSEGWIAHRLLEAERLGDAPRIAQLTALAAQHDLTMPSALRDRLAPLAQAAPPAALPPHSDRLAQVAADRLPTILLVLGPRAESYLARPAPRAVLTIALAALAAIAGWLLLRDLAILGWRRARRSRSRELVVAGPRISRNHVG